jgi:HlyD family secretion protein
MRLPKQKKKSASSSLRSLRVHMRAALLIILVLCGGLAAWASTTELAGALIAPGSVVVDTNVKKVQHPTGGVVGEVRVRDGDRVKAGDIVVRLDETVTRANLAIVVKSLNELGARKARLQTERDGLDTIVFPPELADSTDPDAVRAVASERRLFETRRSVRQGQKSQLLQRITQLEEEISGLTAQQTAKTQEIALIQRELTGVRELFGKNLVQLTRLTQLEREATRLNGERAQLVASVAQARGKIGEIYLQVLQIDQELSSEVAKELREIDAKVGELVERKIAAEDQLKRVEIRAPQDGTVFQSTVHTVGGVIPAGEAIMLIVPDADNLTVEAKINPQDIDQARVGQTAVLRFSAFNQRTTPETTGTVSRISADAAADQRTGQTYYLVRIALSAQSVADLGDVRLVPGMPVEVFIQTGQRTAISYLVKPFKDQLTRSFRER